MSMNYRIIIQTGPDQGKEIVLDKPDLGIGRDGHNEIVINDAEISRYHAHLFLGEKGYLVEDKGSTNGTFVNTKRITEPTLLKNNDIVLLGENISFVFEGDSLEATIPGSVKRISTKQPAKSMPPIPSNRKEELPVVPEPIFPSPVASPSEEFGDQYPVPAPKKKLPTWAWIIIIGVIALLLLCLIPLWIIDLTNSWCNIFGNILHSINPTVCLPLP
jgi:pSer/pThr/pTyr-binding forkhead associated (FHA) protein